MSIKAHLVTGLLSATLAISSVAIWQHFHKSGALAKVDIYGIVNAQQKSLSAQMKPGMDKDAQAAIIESATRFGKQLDTALNQVANECGCTLINAAAIIKDVPTTTNRIVDYTQRVSMLAAAKK